MNDIIRINNLKFSYGKKCVLKDISLNIKEGSFVSIIGANSSGKTTLLKLISGILPNHDTITIGYSYLNPKRDKTDYLKIGFYFNNINMFLFDNVFDEFSFVLENMNIDKSKIGKEIRNLFDFFCISNLLDMKTEDLTQEDKQIVFLLLTLIHKPKIVILDNPFSRMKNSVKKKMMIKLKEYQSINKLTIIMASNNLEDLVLSDYTYVLNDNTIVLEGDTLSVFKEDNYLKRLGIDLPFSAKLSLMLEFYEIYNGVSIDYNEVINRLWN